MYETSIRIMSGYAASKYDNGGNNQMILNELKIPTLEKPEALYLMADAVDKYIYKEYFKAYAHINQALTSSAKKLYSLVLGQCTESKRAKMKGKEDRNNIDDKINSVELLKRIK